MLIFEECAGSRFAITLGKILTEAPDLGPPSALGKVQKGGSSAAAVSYGFGRAASASAASVLSASKKADD